MRNYVLTILLLTSSLLQAAGLEIIPLRYQSAENIIPLIRPLVGKHSVVTGSGYKLIVRGSPQQIDEIRKLLQDIDRPLQQLIISVRQNRQSTHQANQQGIAGNLGNDRNRLQFGRPVYRNGLTLKYQSQDDFLQAQLNQRKTSHNDGISQQVRTLSGQPAYISIGQSRPLPLQQTIIHGNQVIQTQNFYYQDTHSGFYVTPRVHGEQVTLEITTQRQQPAGYHVESSRVSTIVYGKLDEWIALGGSNETTNKTGSGLFQQHDAMAHDMRDVSVRVTLAP